MSEQSGQEIHDEAINPQIAQFIKILANWQKQPNLKNVNDVLIRIYKTITISSSLKSLQKLSKTLQKFLKQINNDDSQSVDESWFNQLKKARNHIDKLITNKNNPNFGQTQNKSKIQQFKIPNQYLQGKSLRQQLIFELLYKNLLVNMKQKIILNEKDKVANFANQLLKHLCQQFEIKKSGYSTPKGNMNNLLNRLTELCQLFNQKSSTIAKQQMLYGAFDAKKVSMCDGGCFLQDLAKRRQKQRLSKLQK